MKRAILLSLALCCAACGSNSESPDELVPADADVVIRLSSLDDISRLTNVLPIPEGDMVPTLANSLIRGSTIDTTKPWLFGLRPGGGMFGAVPVDDPGAVRFAAGDGATRKNKRYVALAEGETGYPGTGSTLVDRIPLGILCGAADLSALVERYRGRIDEWTEDLVGSSTRELGTSSAYVQKRLFLWVRNVIDSAKFGDFAVDVRNASLHMEFGYRPKAGSAIARDLAKKTRLAELLRYTVDGATLVALRLDPKLFENAAEMKLDGLGDEWVVNARLTRDSAGMLIITRVRNEVIIDRLLAMLQANWNVRKADAARMSGKFAIRRFHTNKLEDSAPLAG